MNCPACGNPLSPLSAAGVELDVCRRGCGGIWFDRLELRRLDEASEPCGDELLAIERDPAVVVDSAKRRDCPRCEGQAMMRHFHSPRREIEVDECPRCGGMWLDPGELAAIRQQFATEEERREAARRAFDRLFAEDLIVAERERRVSTDRTRRLAQIFRFLCPSWYIEGKQGWGAF